MARMRAGLIGILQRSASNLRPILWVIREKHVAETKGPISGGTRLSRGGDGEGGIRK